VEVFFSWLFNDTVSRLYRVDDMVTNGYGMVDGMRIGRENMPSATLSTTHPT
jgi:hypothetical protein